MHVYAHVWVYSAGRRRRFACQTLNRQNRIKFTRKLNSLWKCSPHNSVNYVNIGFVPLLHYTLFNITNSSGKILSCHRIRDRTVCAYLSRDVTLGRAQLSQPIALGFKPTLLKPFLINSTLVSFRNKRQLKYLSVSEDKNDLWCSKVQENIFLPIDMLFTAQDIWMFSGNVENNCSNPPCMGQSPPAYTGADSSLVVLF